ncbi:Sensor protein SrrB [compost metagenome]
MFYTANNVRGDGRRGLGLGLALCKSIVNAHGGTIGVRDHFPKGTIFYFTLQAEAVSVYE